MDKRKPKENDETGDPICTRFRNCLSSALTAPIVYMSPSFSSSASWPQVTHPWFPCSFLLWGPSGTLFPSEWVHRFLDEWMPPWSCFIQHATNASILIKVHKEEWCYIKMFQEKIRYSGLDTKKKIALVSRRFDGEIQEKLEKFFFCFVLEPLTWYFFMHVTFTFWSDEHATCTLCGIGID